MSKFSLENDCIHHGRSFLGVGTFDNSGRTPEFMSPTYYAAMHLSWVEQPQSSTFDLLETYSSDFIYSSPLPRMTHTEQPWQIVTTSGLSNEFAPLLYQSNIAGEGQKGESTKTRLRQGKNHRRLKTREGTTVRTEGTTTRMEGTTTRMEGTTVERRTRPWKGKHDRR